jgi:hypothetical protein
MAILLGTPNSRGMISTVHFQMVVQLMDYIRAKRPKLALHHKVSSCTVVGFARNSLASVVLAEPQYSHLLLVDPDLSVPPEAVMAMLDFDHPVVAAPYPARDWNRQAFAEAARRVDDPVVAEACAATYVGGDDDLILVDGPDGKRPISRGSFARVRSCGAGLVLIKRSVFETIARKRPELVLREGKSDYAKIGFKGDTVIECFENGFNLRADQAVEGAGFARLWTEDCGGEIWTHMEATVMRYMEYRFVGHFASKLKLGLI